MPTNEEPRSPAGAAGRGVRADPALARGTLLGIIVYLDLFYALKLLNAR